ncbi:response regulator [Flavobacterium sp. J372]|uniref:sensor histidine kinase n=1 Tax=Flavobacterium sp. J372 TaxID=2898436 RepID=UPI00215112BB|nr:response regulator [Flavobacterium sp. J372]MCR5862016.1 response regulator [Flavobacterium sp. J372]
MILIVDDIAANVIALKKTLELHNLEADTAESGEEALKKILKRNYSLIILDVQMPGMDGFEVAETLAGSSRTKDIPVIFLSAVNKQKRFISKGYESGGVDYITKPVDPDLLILKVKTFMKLYEQQRELKDMRDLLSKEIEIRKEAQQNLEQKVHERTQELVKKNEELEFRNHELQQFTWVVSHDLKEPIRKIQMFVRILIDRFLKDNPSAEDYANRTVRAAERMSQLISDLLDYSRLSGNAVYEAANINEIINEVISDFDFIVEDKAAKINVGPMPIINCVPTQLRQIFQNLISNSLKFSRDGIPPEIEITGELVAEKDFESPAHASGKYCRITVKDNGIGFDEKYLDKIFVIFQSLNDRNMYEGTGIGLAIAKKIIEKHSGLITAMSEPGAGSTFKMILPVNQ